MKKFMFGYLLLFLVIGFAAITTTLNFDANILFGYNESDFDVYFSFASYLESTESVVEIIDKTHFTFKPLITEDDKLLTINYEVVNASHEYDTEIEVICTPTIQTYTSIEHNLVNSFIEARDVTEGTIQIKLNDGYLGSEDINESYSCSLNTTAVSRTTVDNSSIDRFIQIDGIKTNVKEWRTIDLVHQNSTDTVYARSDDDYLYIYAENHEGIDLENIRLYISTAASSSVQIYNYLVENTRVYLYDNGLALDEEGNPLPHVGVAQIACDTGFEYKIPLSSLDVKSIDEIKTIRVRYASSTWNVLKEYDIYLKRDEIIVDGNQTYVNEYTDEDLLYQDGTTTVYSRVLNDYIYFYAFDSELSGGNLANPSIYVGSKSENVTKNPSTGFMIWYETTLLSCDSLSCNTPVVNSSKYSPLRAINAGVEFKIPLEVLDMKTMNDLKVVRLLYRNSSWEEVKTININIKNKISKEDLEGKTYILAKKPSSWENFYIYLNEDVPWPGEEMSLYVDEEDTYAYIFPSDFVSSYVTFSDNGKDQYPLRNQNLFKISAGKSRRWSGDTMGLLSWDYIDKSNASQETTVKFNLVVPSGKTDEGCVYLYDESGSIEKLYPWPGVKLTKNLDKWTGELDIKDYSKVRVIFNNCGKGWQNPAVDGVYIKPGVTISFENDNIYAED